MIHLIWVALICIGFVFAAAQGNIEVVTKAAFDGALPRALRYALD